MCPINTVQCTAGKKQQQQQMYEFTRQPKGTGLNIAPFPQGPIFFLAWQYWNLNYRWIVTANPGEKPNVVDLHNNLTTQ